jgi:hypothetical protein
MSEHPYVYADGKLGHNNRDTSREAAEKHLVRAGSWAHRILRLFEDAGQRGMTDSELFMATQYLSARPRRVGLMHQGFIKPTDERRLCYYSKRPMIVWKLRRYVDGEG